MGLRDKLIDKLKQHQHGSAAPLDNGGGDHPPPIPGNRPIGYQLSDSSAQFVANENFDNDMFSPLQLSTRVEDHFQSVRHPVSLPQNTFDDLDRSRSLSHPVETNSFYTNLLLETQTAPVWTHPYSLWYSNKPEEQQTFGIAVGHTTAAQRVFGGNPDKPNETQYYFNPAGIQSFVIGAAEFNKSVQLGVDKCEKFSCQISLSQNAGVVKLPVVQGMGFVTANYTNLTPMLTSAVGIKSFVPDQRFKKNGIIKYNVTLFNEITWSMYATDGVRFQLRSPNCIVADRRTTTTVQLASGSHEAYDFASGAYPVACRLSGRLTGDAIFNFNYEIKGSGDRTVMFALPHHVQSFTQEMAAMKCQGLVLDSTVAGPMQAYLTNKFTMVEKLPSGIGFEPWVSNAKAPLGQYSDRALSAIRAACLEDIKDDVEAMSNTDSMYTSGKILDKYAMVLYVIVFILKDSALAQQFLPKVKAAMARFATNKQQCPLVYDSTWKGLVSSAGLDGNIFKDFGNTHYNDHHFHYGYHIHAAAVVALCDNTIGDGSFLAKHRDYYTFLVKDVANPIRDDEFPHSRSFDWFNGHSWAKGLFSSFDGKDEESSSEDYHFAYALKLWGKITGDKNLETRGDLMLAIMKRAMGLYMLYKDDNPIQPPQIIRNKVSGILFENKIDHATYFGLNLEYIQGIHMLPITPISSYIRDPEFVRQEWEQLLARHVHTLQDGWKGILMMNLALYDPKQSWQFFNQPRFDKRFLDNGMSLTWSLAFIAGIGGC